METYISKGEVWERPYHYTYKFQCRCMYESDDGFEILKDAIDALHYCIDRHAQRCNKTGSTYRGLAASKKLYNRHIVDNYTGEVVYYYKSN